MSMHASNPILDNASMPSSSMSKQSVILDGVQSLNSRINSFSRMTAGVLITMGLMTLANFGTSVAALLYIKDMYVDDNSNMLVNSYDEPVGTSAAMDVQDFTTFPTYEDVLEKIAGGMAIYNGTSITRVDQGIVEMDGNVLLYDANGNHIGSAAVDSIDTIPVNRHLEGIAGGIQKMAFVNSVSSGSRLCKDPKKGCYDVWKRECIPCSGEYRGITQDKTTTNIGNEKSCWTAVHCPTGWACNTETKKCVEHMN